MLDRMRKHSRSFLIYVLFGIIIGIFVVNFGPQSGGCVSNSTQAGAIAGRAVTINDLSYALAVSDLANQGLAEDQLTMVRSVYIDLYVVRELMVERALDLGMRVADAEVEDMLLAGRYLALGQAKQLMRGENGAFDYDLFSRYVRYNWGITVKRFKEEQRRELLAQKLRHFLQGAVSVAESEVQRDFVARETQLALHYVRFAPSELREQVRLSSAQIDAFVAQRAQEIRKYYEVNRTAFSGLPPQLLLRLIELPAALNGDRQAASAAAERLAARARAGEDLAALAREASVAASAAVDGLLGWRTAAAPGIAPAVDTALQQLKDGVLSPVIADADRLYLVRIEGRRSGNVTLAQAQREIAVELARDEGAQALAKSTADRFLAQLKAGAPFETLFAAAPSAGDDGEAASASATAETAAASATAAATTGSDSGESRPAGEQRFELRSTSLFSRSVDDVVPGIGASAELSRAVFRLKRGEAARQAFTVSGMIYLVAVKERKDPDMQEWTKRQSELAASYRGRKAQELIQRVEREICQEAVERKRVTIDPRALARPASEGGTEDKSADYVPCRALQAAAAMF